MNGFHIKGEARIKRNQRDIYKLAEAGDMAKRKACNERARKFLDSRPSVNPKTVREEMMAAGVIMPRMANAKRLQGGRGDNA